MRARTLGLLILAALMLAAGLGGVVEALRLERTALEGWTSRSLVPSLERTLGRQVSVENVAVDLVPVPRVFLAGLRVSGSGSRPLLTVQSVEVSFRLGPLLLSQGQDLQVDRIALRGPELNLVLLPGGQWDHTAVVERLGHQPDWSYGSPDRVTIQGGRVRRIDTTTPEPSASWLLHLDLAASARAGEGFWVALKATLGHTPENLSASMVVKTRPGTLELSGLQVRGPGLDLGGSAALSLAGPRLTFDLLGPLLDLDALREAYPSEKRVSSKPSVSATGMQAAGTLSVQRLVAREAITENVTARASAGSGVLRFEKGTGKVRGATVDLSGTQLQLPGD